MKLTAGQAAKQTGVSVPTITRAIKKGRISAEPVEGGGYLIDPAELFRVFPAVTRNPDNETGSLGDETPNETRSLGVEIEVLREKLRIIEAERERERGQLTAQVQDLKEDRDHWREQAERATRLIPPPEIAAPPTTAAAERPSLFARLFRSGRN